MEIIMQELHFFKNGKEYAIVNNKVVEYHKEIEDFDKDVYEQGTSMLIKQHYQIKDQRKIDQERIQKEQRLATIRMRTR